MIAINKDCTAYSAAFQNSMFTTGKTELVIKKRTNVYFSIFCSVISGHNSILANLANNILLVKYDVPHPSTTFSTRFITKHGMGGGGKGGKVHGGKELKGNHLILLTQICYKIFLSNPLQDS